MPKVAQEVVKNAGVSVEEFVVPTKGHKLQIIYRDMAYHISTHSGSYGSVDSSCQRRENFSRRYASC